MTVNELIERLQGLVEAHGDEQLYVGKEKLKADVGIGGLDNAAVIWLHAGPFAQLAIRGKPKPVDVNSRGYRIPMAATEPEQCQEQDCNRTYAHRHVKYALDKDQ